MINPLNELSAVYNNCIAESYVVEQDNTPEAVAQRVAQMVKAIRYRARKEGSTVSKAFNDYIGSVNATSVERQAVKEKLGLTGGVQHKEEYVSEVHVQAHKPHEVPSKNLKGLVAKAVKRIDTDVDGDTDKNDKAKGELGEFIPGVGNKRLYSTTGTKTAKESFSNWRQDLSEVMDEVEASKEIKEKKVKNKVVINPVMKEAVQELGGEILEVSEIEEGMDLKDFKANRRKLKRREASADAKKRGHVGKEWYNSGQTYSTDHAKRMRSKLDDEERSTRHRSSIDPEGDDSNYSADKTKNPKKLRKQKAMGELGEAVYGGKKEEPKDTRYTVTAADKKGNTAAYQKYKSGDKRYKAAPHLGEENEIDEGMTMKDFKANRRKLKRREASADAKKRGHVGKEWYNSGRTYSPDEAKSGRAKLDDAERRTRHRSAVDPDNDNDDNYSADKTKNPKKIRKQKAMGELGEGTLQEKALSKQQQKFMGMVYAVKKGEMEAPSPEVAKAAAGMTKQQAKDFAKTKHNGLPNVKESATEMPMTPQELNLQKRKTAIDVMIAKRRQQALLKNKNQQKF